VVLLLFVVVVFFLVFLTNLTDYQKKNTKKLNVTEVNQIKLNSQILIILLQRQINLLLLHLFNPSKHGNLTTKK